MELSGIGLREQGPELLPELALFRYLFLKCGEQVAVCEGSNRRFGGKCGYRSASWRITYWRMPPWR